MPYISTERVKQIREQIKKEFPSINGWKFSITKDSSTIRVTILSAPFNMLTVDKKYESVNHYYISSHYEQTPIIKDALLKIYSIMNAGNYTESTDGDYGNIPSFYCHISIGDFEKPFTVAEVVKAEVKNETAVIVTTGESTPVVAAGEVQIIDYSEKAIAVIGDTKPIKEKLSALRGRFNSHLKCGAGWIFPKTRLTEVQNALNLATA